MAEKQKGRIAIFGCGGAGINLATLGEKLAKANDKQVDTRRVGEAIPVPYYIDTSGSNIPDNIPTERRFLFSDVDEGIDGSGSIRKENHSVIAEHVLKILQKLPALDLNIVIHSGGGGSGSVIGPSLVSELLERDEQVVVILIGATDTKNRINNTLNTLKSYDGIVKKRNRPVSVLYLENSAKVTREQNDKAVAQAIATLSFIYSRENAELDSRDLYNVLNFHNSTTYQPQVAALSILTGKITSLDELTISVATVSLRDADTALPSVPDYQAVGYFPPGIDEIAKKTQQIHMVITANLLAAASRQLAARLEELNTVAASRVVRADILDKGDTTTDAGLVL